MKRYFAFLQQPLIVSKTIRRSLIGIAPKMVSLLSVSLDNEPLICHQLRQLIVSSAANVLLMFKLLRSHPDTEKCLSVLTSTRLKLFLLCNVRKS